MSIQALLILIAVCAGVILAQLGYYCWCDHRRIKALRARREEEERRKAALTDEERDDEARAAALLYFGMYIPKEGR